MEPRSRTAEAPRPVGLHGSLSSVGIVRNGIHDTEHRDWSHVVSTIEFNRDLELGVLGLELFSHVLVVYWMHQVYFVPQLDLVRRPLHKGELPPMGVFARRASERPNPIGVTAAPVRSVKEGILVVTGLDAIDGTPVIDVKPYNPVYDHVEGPRVPFWSADTSLW